MGIYEQKSLQTKTDLANAFWQLYQEKPISTITIKELVERAGYNRSTLYYHFPDIYSILEYIEANILNEWEKMLTEIITTKQSTFLRGDFSELFPLLHLFLQKNGEQIMFLLGPSGDPQFQQRVKDTLRTKLFSLLEIPEDAHKAVLIFDGLASFILSVYTNGYTRGLSMEILSELVYELPVSAMFSVLVSYSSNPAIRTLTIT